MYLDDKTTEGDEYASAPDITPWQTKVTKKYAIKRISMPPTMPDILFFDFFDCFLSSTDLLLVISFN